MRAWWRKRKGVVIALAIIVLIGVIALIPHIWWRVTSPTRLDVLVVNKSIPGPDTRKHRGLFWILNHEKIVDPSTGHLLDQKSDYVGYHPNATSNGGEIVPVPAEPADLVYISDTYGVYEDRDGMRSSRVELGADDGARRVAGGLDLGEVEQLIRNVRPAGTLMGEFNILPTPTTESARTTLEETFGIESLHWAGRHFEYLQITPDLPSWIPDLWRRQTGTRWPFRGPGYVLVSGAEEIVVLVEGVDIPEGGLTLRVTDDAADRFGTATSVRYDTWFEIVRPLPTAAVLANYDLELTPSGREKMRVVPAGTRFPAIVRTESSDLTTYYFAGDWSDRLDSGIYRYSGITRFRRFLATNERDTQEQTFWRVYVPLMQYAIKELEGNRRAAQQP